MSENSEKKDWIVTYSGKKFWPLEPRPQDIDIVDIAHHLSNICRFTGAVSQFYSVAQHSVLVSKLCDNHPLFGLLHDGSEAYLCDVATPVKQSDLFAEYRAAESHLQRMILLHFGIRNGDTPDEVKSADMAMGIIEGLSFMPKAHGAFWTDNAFPHREGMRLAAWSPGVAKARFLDRFDELTRN